MDLPMLPIPKLLETEINRMLRNAIAYGLIGVSMLFVLSGAYWAYGVATGIDGAVENLVVAFVMVTVLSGIGHRLKDTTPSSERV